MTDTLQGTTNFTVDGNYSSLNTTTLNSTNINSTNLNTTNLNVNYINGDISFNGNVVYNNAVIFNSDSLIQGNVTINGNFLLDGASIGVESSGLNNWFGINSLQSRISPANNNASFGAYALTSLKNGCYNCAFGNGSGYNDLSGSYNTNLGYGSGFSNQTGSNNLTAGALSLYNCGGSNNVCLGFNSMYVVQNYSSNNTSVGYNSGDCALGINNTFYNNNTFVGANTSTSANFNNSSCLGYGAVITANNQIVLGTSGETVYIPNIIKQGLANNNTQFGNCLMNTSGSNNTAISNNSLNNSSGSDNTSVGYNCLANVTSGSNNSGIGSSSLKFLTSGIHNNSHGFNSLTNTTTGVNNTAMGSGSGQLNSTGNSNSSFGYQAGLHNTTGVSNSYFGVLADCSAGNYSYSTAIGSYSLITGSHQIVIGTSAETIFVSGKTNLIGDLSMNANILLGNNTKILGKLNLINDASMNGNLVVSGNTLLTDITVSGNTILADVSTSGKFNTLGSLTITSNGSNVYAVSPSNFSITYPAVQNSTFTVAIAGYYILIYDISSSGPTTTYSITLNGSNVITGSPTTTTVSTKTTSVYCNAGSNTVQFYNNFQSLTISNLFLKAPSLYNSGITYLNGDTFLNGKLTSTSVNNSSSMTTGSLSVAGSTSTDSLSVNAGITATNGPIYLSPSQPTSIFRFVPWTTVTGYTVMGQLMTAVNYTTGAAGVKPAFNNSYTFTYKYSIVGNTVYLQFYYNSSASSLQTAGSKYFFLLPYPSTYVPQNTNLLTYTSGNFNIPTGNVIGTGYYYVAGVYQNVWSCFMANTNGISGNPTGIALYAPVYGASFGYDNIGFGNNANTVFTFECCYEIAPTGTTLNYS